VTQPPTVTLGEVADVQGGLQVTRKRASLPIEVPYLRVANVYRDRLDLAEMKTMRVTEPELSRVSLKRGDILVVEGHGNPLEIGRTSVWDGSIEPCIHQNHLIRVRMRNGSAIPHYVSTFLNSPVGRRQLIKAGRTTSGLNTINITNVRELQVPLPPLPEQKRIAAILDKADEIRRKRQQALELTEQLLRSAFLDMFGDPVTNPKGWPRAKFEEVGTLDRGRSRHRPRNDPALLGGPYPLIQTGEVSNCDGEIRDYTSTYSELGLKQSRMWPARTLCITIAANIAKTGVLTFDACFPDSVVGFHPGEGVTTEFVQQWLSFLQPTLEAQAPQSAQKNINLRILRALELPLPPLNLQRKYSNLVQQYRTHRAQMTEHEVKLQDLQGSLTRRAFRGEL